MNRRLGLIALAAGCVTLAGCFFGGDDDDAESTPAATNTLPSASPVPTATPDPAATPPLSQSDARRWLLAVLTNPAAGACPERLKLVGAACAEGDVDADGSMDAAYLIPVKAAVSLQPHPAAVFVRRGGSGRIDEFSVDLTADPSAVGLAFFHLDDRTGDGKADLAFIENRCGAVGCKSTAHIWTWDGTSWRDAGPGDAGIVNVDSAVWSAKARNEFEIHGGKLAADAPREAGPSRSATTTFKLTGPRYTVSSIERDAPQYLYELFLDAEETFATDRQAAIAEFEQVAQSNGLKDWKPRDDYPDRRPALVGFALFRIVLATAVQQKEPAAVTAALDRVILQSAQPGFEPLFVNLAMEFRRGYNERDGLAGGCAAVNLYLSRPAANGADTGKYVQQIFDYGYTNPPGASWIPKICPF